MAWWWMGARRGRLGTSFEIVAKGGTSQADQFDGNSLLAHVVQALVQRCPWARQLSAPDAHPSSPSRARSHRPYLVSRALRTPSPKSCSSKTVWLLHRRVLSAAICMIRPRLRSLPVTRPRRYLRQPDPLRASINIRIYSPFLRPRISLLHTASIMSAKPVVITLKTGKKLTVPTGLFINNEFVPSVDSKETIECVSAHSAIPPSWLEFILSSLRSVQS